MAGILFLAMVSAGCNEPWDRWFSFAGGKAPGIAKTTAAVGWLDPDNEKDSITYADLVKENGGFTMARRSYRLGALVRFLGNPYYRLMIEGMHACGSELGVYIDAQAGATESDQAGQLAALKAMIDAGYDAILISPQTDKNLKSAVESARAKGVALVLVDAAVPPGVERYVGPNQYESGAAAARYLTSRAKGGKVAVLQGYENDYGDRRRVRGFMDTLSAGPYQIVAQPECFRDLQVALQSAAEIMHKDPDIVCFYATSDMMALGAVQAVKMAGRSDSVIVLGRDGIPAALDSIKSGELEGTVNTFPFETGKTAVDIAVRILNGQKLPGVIVTRQEFVGGRLMDR